ncbi:type II toxin-antitoxin system RelE/ParE family toxin [Selenomonas sp.]|jgi:mRNA interferase RelE/StbE|uniref:type II toxin-antitoxin system RelE family toxin n=1 Tax=Selenomonas sp. TaxID=2053611 RepID=UPI001CB40429|nr:type II toxin-antitoxin system RelE/ParE family toxin [Selenomonas sp.]MBF1694670.1 type II toxin-antitoxin system RelE/ParE family toxin [Selenomonas sp.]
MDIEFSRSAAKFLQSADRPTRSRVKAGILGLIQQPPIGDIKVLQGWKPLSCRLRIGKYRVVYSYLQRKSGDTYLYIRDIGARGGIYK